MLTVVVLKSTIGPVKLVFGQKFAKYPLAMRVVAVTVDPSDRSRVMIASPGSGSALQTEESSKMKHNAKEAPRSQCTIPKNNPTVIKS